MFGISSSRDLNVVEYLKNVFPSTTRPITPYFDFNLANKKYLNSQFVTAHGATNVEKPYGDCATAFGESEKTNNVIDRKIAAIRSSIEEAFELISNANTQFAKDGMPVSRAGHAALIRIQTVYKDNGLTMLDENRRNIYGASDKCAIFTEMVSVMKTNEKTAIAGMMDAWINNLMGFEFPDYTPLTYFADDEVSEEVIVRRGLAESRLKVEIKLQSATTQARMLVTRHIKTSKLRQHLLDSTELYVSHAVTEIKTTRLKPGQTEDSDFYAEDESKVKSIYIHCLYSMRTVSI